MANDMSEGAEAELSKNMQGIAKGCKIAADVAKKTIEAIQSGSHLQNAASQSAVQGNSKVMGR